jgi:hypothetical protein
MVFKASDKHLEAGHKHLPPALTSVTSFNEPVTMAHNPVTTARKVVKLTSTKYTKELFWAGWRVFEVPRRFRDLLGDFDIDSCLDNQMRYLKDFGGSCDQ